MQDAEYKIERKKFLLLKFVTYKNYKPGYFRYQFLKTIPYSSKPYLCDRKKMD